MVPEQKPTSNSGPQDPYGLLGIEPGATFEVIKKAREDRIADAGDDPIKKAKIEAAYDNLLMVSLKSRQLGNVSNEAANASQREKITNKEIGAVGSSILTRLKGVAQKQDRDSNSRLFPNLNLPAGQGLTIRISLGILAFLLLLVSPDQSIQLILSISTIGLFISQIKRGRKPLSSLGWSVVLLSIGLILGGLLSIEPGSSPGNLQVLTSDKLEAIPALFLLFLGTVLLE